MSFTVQLDAYTQKVEETDGTVWFKGCYKLTAYTGKETEYHRRVLIKGKDEPIKFSTESEAKEAAELTAKQHIDQLKAQYG